MPRHAVIIGGGAAGFFGAIRCAESATGTRVTLLERSSALLAKVRISGGGRCNVTNVRTDPRELAQGYPRGGRALIGPLTRFGPRETVAWFAARGVELKREPDGRMFPVTDSSATVIDCLLRAAREAGVEIRTGLAAESIARDADGGLLLRLSGGDTIACDRVLFAPGGARSETARALPLSAGHTLEPPVPSLFTFQIEAPWLTGLSGLSVDPAEVRIPETRLAERGPILLTHAGLSGPAILRLSAWGARILHGRAYRFPVEIDWFPDRTLAQLDAALIEIAARHGARRIAGTGLAPLPARLWEQLVLQAGIAADARWSGLDRSARGRLAEQLHRTRLDVVGRTLNKDEFVTCGGIPLGEVDLRTMESRRFPGLYFAGEILDIDGITGGYNFQAAWTTGWIAGSAMAATLAGA